MVLEQLYGGRRRDDADDEMKDDDLADRSCNDTKYPYPFVEVSARFNIPVNFIHVEHPINKESFFTVVDVSTANIPPTASDVINLTVNNRSENKVLTYEELFASLSQRFHFPLEWLKLCNDYVLSLKPEDKMTLFSYTNEGYRISNRLIRSVHQYPKQHKNLRANNGEVVIPGQVASLPNYSDDAYEQASDSAETDSYFGLYFPIRRLLLTRPVEQYLIDPSNDDIVRAANSLVSKLKASLKSWDANRQPYHRLTKGRELEMLFNEKLIVDATVLYTQVINNIICNAPPLPKDALVFRGVSNSLFYSLDDKTTFQNVHFMSSTYDLSKARRFTIMPTTCCMKYILLPKGTRCLWLDCITGSPGEHEILLPTDNTFKIVEQSLMPLLSYDTFAPKHDVETRCDVGQTKMKTTILKLVSQACPVVIGQGL